MKNVWKGNISFGLITIPIELYTAVQERALAFHVIHNACHTQINYLRWCPHCKKQVGWRDIAKALLIKNGKEVVLTEADIRALKPEKTDLLVVTECIDKSELTTIYYHQHYYVVPQKSAEKAYFLLSKALSNVNKVAVGTFVMCEKEHIAALEPYENGLLLSTLNYSQEIVSLEIFKKLLSPVVNKRELQLAEDLIKIFSVKKFNITVFKNAFLQKLEKKLRHPLKKATKSPSEKKKKSVTTLHNLLEQSIAQHTRTKRK